MEKIAIITDSCSDVSKEYREKYDIYVLPMVVQHNEKEYKDGIDITAEDVYRLQENDILKTASPAGSDVLDTFEEIKKKGGIYATCVRRAEQVCMAAMYRAKISLYPSTADIWQSHLNEVLQIPQLRFLPPVLPQ